MSYHRMKLAVGLFVITLVIAISSLLYLFLEKKGTFEQRYIYNIKTSSANFFTIGMPLKLSGFEIGLIETISLENDASVHLTFSVQKENRKWISEGTLLLLKKPLIGSPHISVHSLIDKKPLPPNSTLTVLISDDINDMITKFEPAVNKAITIINNLEVITGLLANENSYLLSTLKNLEQFSNNLANSDSLLSSITGDQESTKNLIQTLNQTTTIMSDINVVSQSLSTISQDLMLISNQLDNDIMQPTSSLINGLDDKVMIPISQAIKNVDKILLDIQNKLADVDGTVKTIGRYDHDLEKMKEEISAAIQKSNLLMDKIDNFIDSDENTEISLP